ncbi:SDR family oxidoreductase [Roseateles sp. P5_E7]
MSKYASIAVGDKAELSHTITQQDIDHFVQLTGDDNRLHIDAGFAETTVFKKPVAHGMLGASFISTVIGTKLPGDGALWFSQSLEFVLPVRIGDTIFVRAEVVKKHDRNNVIELKTEIFNQHKQLVTTGLAKVKIVEPEAPVITALQPERRKIALVVGASGGIGQAVCRQLAEDGFDIAIHYHRNQDAAQRLQQNLQGLGIRCIKFSANIIDSTQTTELVEQVSRKLGRITVIVNCVTPKTPVIALAALEWSDMQLHLDADIRGLLNIVKAALPSFEASRYGKIINVTSQMIETPPAGLLHYVTAKAALNGFSKALAVDLAPKGVTVNMVSPGMTDTELIADVSEKTRLLVAARAPLRRLAKPEDVAGAVSFLASAKADYLTGETIRVNGGQVML